MGELANKVRAKFPGEYDDLDDNSLEQKVLAKYPEYADLAAPAVNPKEYSKKLVKDPAFRKQTQEFIEREGARNLKQEAVRGLPMGNRIADATLGKYSSPLNAEEAVTDAYGPKDAESSTLTGAMVQGLGDFVRRPARQLEGAIAFPADIVSGGVNAALNPRSEEAKNYGKDLATGVAAPLGLSDIAEGNLDFPKARQAWENEFLGSAMIAAGTPKAVKGVYGKTVKPVVRGATDLTLRGIDKIPGMSDSALYRQALDPGQSMQLKKQRNQNAAVETGLDKEVVISGTQDTYAGKSINDLINDTFGDEGGLWQKGEAIVTSPEFKNARIDLTNIENSAKAATSELAAGQKDTAKAAVDKVVSELKQHESYDPQTNTISAEGAYREKQKLYRALDKAFETDNLAGLKDAQTEVASGLRRVTGEVIPELKDILRQEGENLNFIKYAKRQAAKIEKQGVISGSGLGLIMNAKKYIAMKIFQSPGFKSRLAIAMRQAKKRAASPAEVNAVVDALIQDASVVEPKPFNPEEVPAKDASGLGDYIPGREQTIAPESVQRPDLSRQVYDPSTGGMINATGQGIATPGLGETVVPEGMRPQTSGAPTAPMTQPGPRIETTSGPTSPMTQPRPVIQTSGAPTAPLQGGNVAGSQPMTSGAPTAPLSQPSPVIQQTQGPTSPIQGGNTAQGSLANLGILPGSPKTQLANAKAKVAEIKKDLQATNKKGKAAVEEVARLYGISAAALATYLLASDKKRKLMLMKGEI